jgi:hypothetical protein
MNVFKYIKCFFFGHDISGNKSIVKTFCRNNWIKKCNCCGRYIMNGDIGSICISEKEAFKFKREFDELFKYRDTL